MTRLNAGVVVELQSKDKAHNINVTEYPCNVLFSISHFLRLHPFYVTINEFSEIQIIND